VAVELTETVLPNVSSAVSPSTSGPAVPILRTREPGFRSTGEGGDVKGVLADVFPVNRKVQLACAITAVVPDVGTGRGVSTGGAVAAQVPVAVGAASFG
jgi:hypothetical protein